MVMRYLKFTICFIFSLSTQFLNAQSNISINPSGVYKYDGKTYRKNGETYGYFGTVKVLQLSSTKILVSFYVCKGAPSYNSGSFVDSLDYSNNQATYLGDTSMIETTCKLIFHFTAQRINIELFSEYPNMACGFGHAVDAQGLYKKVGAKPPIMEEIVREAD